MASAAIDNISGVGANSSVGAARMGGASDRNIDSAAGALSQALTGGGKAKFDSPGEQQNFNDGLRDAVRDMSKGAERASSEGKSPMQDKQFQDGMKQLIQLLEQLLGQKGEKGEGKEGGQGGKGAGKSEGAPSAGGGEQSGGGEDDMIKKLIALLKQMGMGDKEIAALLGQLGLPANQINAALQGAGQGEDGASAGSSMAADPMQSR